MNLRACSLTASLTGLLPMTAGGLVTSRMRSMGFTPRRKTLLAAAVRRVVDDRRRRQEGTFGQVPAAQRLALSTPFNLPSASVERKRCHPPSPDSGWSVYHRRAPLPRLLGVRSATQNAGTETFRTAGYRRLSERCSSSVPDDLPSRRQRSMRRWARDLDAFSASLPAGNVRFPMCAVQTMCHRDKRHLEAHRVPNPAEVEHLCTSGGSRTPL